MKQKKKKKSEVNYIAEKSDLDNAFYNCGFYFKVTMGNYYKKPIIKNNWLYIHTDEQVLFPFFSAASYRDNSY